MARAVKHFEIPWIWLRIGLFLLAEGIVVITYHFQQDRTRATLVFLGSVVATAFALYSILRGIEDKRIQEAGKYIERWNASDRTAIRTTMNALSEGNLDPMQLGRHSKGEVLDAARQEKRVQVISALNFYEELAIGIFENTVEEEKCYRFFSSIIEQTYMGLKGWIENERLIDKNQSYYVEFERLAEQWRRRRSY